MPSSGSSKLPPLSGRIPQTGLGRQGQSVGVPATAFADAAPGKSVVIVVHGTFSRHAPYMKPDSPQFKDIKAQHPGSQVTPFYWSGDLSRTDRRHAGMHLARVIERFNEQGVKVKAVIAHSHGCNVFKEAANELKSTTWGPIAQPRVDTFSAIASPERMEHSAKGLEDKRICGHVVQVEGGRDFVKPLGEVSPADAVRTGKAALTQLASTLRGLLPGAPKSPPPQMSWAGGMAVLPRVTHKGLVHDKDTFKDALSQARTLSAGSGSASLPTVGPRALQIGRGDTPRGATRVPRHSL